MYISSAAVSIEWRSFFLVDHAGDIGQSDWIIIFLISLIRVDNFGFEGRCFKVWVVDNGVLDESPQTVEFGEVNVDVVKVVCFIKTSLLRFKYSSFGKHTDISSIYSAEKMLAKICFFMVHAIILSVPSLIVCTHQSSS